jgi:hypothetical protein
LLETKEIIPVVCDPLTDEGRKVWGKVAAVVDVGASSQLLDTPLSES